MLLKKHVSGEKMGQHMMCPVIDATEKICFGRENRAVCDVHTALLLMPLEKYVLGEKAGQHVMCTLPQYFSFPH
jgi:hypothetical protein